MNSPKTNYPKVGVGVLILKDNKVLLHKRKGSHGSGEYATPGGHLEYMESFVDCAKRETREEAGIEIENIRLLYVANLTQYKPKHYVHIELLAELASGEPQNLELEKGEEWNWYELDNLPSPLFATEAKAIETYRNRSAFFDTDFEAILLHKF